ncbi:MAG TPA: 4-(cytidine 5'-diphospho)-2-C-methyl-D-erythritol kinase [Coriobacteriia bacterium]|nr:4-(cytidine 5'-diphospho)-2-C-methyl-D-erythritol kinase [Coriobacteriia bacterium]
MSDSVHVLAPAKVNLFLGVGGVRPDGYHTVDAVFHELDLADELSLAAADGLSVTCVPDVGVGVEDNLAAKAAREFGRLVGREPSVHIAIRKHVPHGAGLGGGSSDAAAVIRGLARMWGIDIFDERCWTAARSVGADVAFFLVGGAALMTERGDHLVRILPASNAHAVLVRPPEPVSTAAAYRAFDAAPEPAGDASGVVHALETGDSAALGTALANNFEPISTALVPSVGDALEWVATQDEVLGSVMAGSGSAVFAITGSEQISERVAAAARARGWWGMPTRLVSAPNVEEGLA